MNDLVKLDLKLFATEDSALDPAELIPVFHRFIQTSALDDLLVDVADYRHVPEGPAVLLLSHDAQYVWDLEGNRPGLLYSRRRETHPSLGPITSLEERLRSVLRKAIVAARRLEEEPKLHGRLRFRSDELVLTANDRLRAPNDRTTVALLRPALHAVLEELVGGEVELSVAADDPRGRARLEARLPAQPDLAALLAALEASSCDGERPVAVSRGLS
jgi:hypothetical protein